MIIEGHFQIFDRFDPFNRRVGQIEIWRSHVRSNSEYDGLTFVRINLEIVSHEKPV